MDRRTLWWVVIAVGAVFVAVVVDGIAVRAIPATRASTSTSTTGQMPPADPVLRPGTNQPLSPPETPPPPLPSSPQVTAPPPTTTTPTTTTPTTTTPTTTTPTTTTPTTTTPTTTTLPAKSTPIPISAEPQVEGAVAYQMTPGHTGYSTDDVGPDWTRAWSDNMRGPLSYPLVVGGNVYVIAEGDPAVMYSISASTGRMNWSESVGAATGAAYADGRLFTVTYGGIMFAYSAATGAVVWSLELPGQSEYYTPTAADGGVYAGAAGVGGTLYGVNASSGSLDWSGSVANGDTSIPAVSATGTYVSYACQQSYDFNPSTGARVWHYKTSCEGGGGATPVLTGNYLLVQDTNLGDIVLNASTGKFVRTFRSGPTPATNGSVMFVENAGSLQAQTLSGGLVEWNFDGDKTLDTSPIVVNQTVYEGSSSGTLYAVSALTGAEQWSASLPGPITGNMAEGDGYLVVPTGDTLTTFRPAN